MWKNVKSILLKFSWYSRKNYYVIHVEWTTATFFLPKFVRQTLATVVWIVLVIVDKNFSAVCLNSISLTIIQKISTIKYCVNAKRNVLPNNYQILTNNFPTRHQDIVATTTTTLCASQRRRSCISNETPNDVSVVRHQDVSVVRIRNVPLVCLYDVSWKSQMKHQITLLWYVSTTSWSYAVATPYL